MNRKATTLIVLGLLIAAAAAAWTVLGRHAEALPVRTSQVARVEKLASSLTASGTFHLTAMGKSAPATSHSQALVVLNIDETQITKVKQDQPARITFDALRETQAVAGRVSRIGMMALPVAGENGRVFRVEVGVDNPPAQAREGMSCQAEFTLAERENVLAIPISALTSRLGVADAAGNYASQPQSARSQAPSWQPQKPGQQEFQGVFVRGADGLAHFRVVRTGIMGDMVVELLGGLKEGEEVITGPQASLRQILDFTPVRPETEADRVAAAKRQAAEAENKKSK